MLHSLHIENFKSLKSVSLRLQQVNLLIGPNNSGKTNLLKALELWGKIMNGESGGIRFSELARTLPQVSFKREVPAFAPPHIRFRASTTNAQKNGILFYPYSTVQLRLIFNRLKPLDYIGDYELCYTTSSDIELLEKAINLNIPRFEDLEQFPAFVYLSTIPGNIAVPDDYTNISISGQSGRAILKGEPKQRLTAAAVPSLLNDEEVYKNTWTLATPFYHYIKDAFIYKPDPRKMMSIAPLYAGNERLLADASNMVAFLDTMLGKYPEVIRAMEQDLERCVGDFVGIRLNPEDVPQNDDLRKLHGDKTFKRLGLKDKRDVIYWADELSEGTLYFLALLAIVHQPNPPKLLMLEEPETAIHPRRIREVLDLIFSLAEEKDIQVIMTTHSPLVVDAFAEMPEAIHVVDIDNGETSIRNLQYDIIAPAHADCDAKGLPRINYTESLGEHWSIGFLGGVPK